MKSFAKRTRSKRAMKTSSRYMLEDTSQSEVIPPIPARYESAIINVFLEGLTKVWERDTKKLCTVMTALGEAPGRVIQVPFHDAFLVYTLVKIHDIL
jgi:hypothetical protein